MVVFAVMVLGAGVGAGVRAVLARMRRGAVVARGWCEGGLALLWGLPVAGTAAGAVPVAWLPTALGLGVLTVAATATDVRHRRLPDRLTLPAAALAPLAVLPLGAASAGVGVLGGLVMLLAHAAVLVSAPTALGAGDVKLAASLGVPLAALSWWALLAMPIVAALIVTALARRTGVPFGPPMLAATWGVIAVVVLAR